MASKKGFEGFGSVDKLAAAKTRYETAIATHTASFNKDLKNLFDCAITKLNDVGDIQIERETLLSFKELKVLVLGPEVVKAPAVAASGISPNLDFFGFQKAVQAVYERTNVDDSFTNTDIAKELKDEGYDPIPKSMSGYTSAHVDKLVKEDKIKKDGQRRGLKFIKLK